MADITNINEPWNNHVMSEVEGYIKGAFDHTSVKTSLPASGGLVPGVLYSISEMSTCTITLASGVSGKLNEYMLAFNTGSSAPTITWPSGLTWAGGSAPSINTSKHYEVSIVNNYAVCREF